MSLSPGAVVDAHLSDGRIKRGRITRRFPVPPIMADLLIWDVTFQDNITVGFDPSDLVLVGTSAGIPLDAYHDHLEADDAA